MLSQAKVLGHALSLWGVASDKDKMKKFTDDDHLQAMSILFTEGLSNSIPFTLAYNIKNWLSMDEWNAKRKDTFKIIHKQFVDEDVVLQFPDIWNAEETKSKINSKTGDGFHANLNYDLNNKS